jgi:multicomponent Na+:H+ antiporter subunit F
MTLVADALAAGALALVVLALVTLVRVALGPTLPDRVVAVNGAGTLTVVVLALFAVGLDEPGLLDVALVYALLNFLLSLGLSTFALERGGIL